MGEQHYKRVSKKFMLIYNFLRRFFTMKVVENSPQNAQNCTILKKFIGGGACPQTPLAKACSFACGFKIPEILKLSPPPEKSCIRPCFMLLIATNWPKVGKLYNCMHFVYYTCMPLCNDMI